MSSQRLAGRLQAKECIGKAAASPYRHARVLHEESKYISNLSHCDFTLPPSTDRCSNKNQPQDKSRAHRITIANLRNLRRNNYCEVAECCDSRKKGHNLEPGKPPKHFNRPGTNPFSGNVLQRGGSLHFIGICFELRHSI